MSEQPRYGAPSPADGPTTPGTGAISRAEVAGSDTVDPSPARAADRRRRSPSPSRTAPPPPGRACRRAPDARGSAGPGSA